MSEQITPAFLAWANADEPEADWSDKTEPLRPAVEGLKLQSELTCAMLWAAKQLCQLLEIDEIHAYEDTWQGYLDIFLAKWREMSRRVRSGEVERGSNEAFEMEIKAGQILEQLEHYRAFKKKLDSLRESQS